MLALIADIHGNLTALEAVLADCERQGVSRIVCLGDVASFGPQPQATLERVQELNCPVVMGNTDAYLLKPRTLTDVDKPNEDSDFFLEVEAWSAAQLDGADKHFVKSFKPVHAFDYRGHAILAYHGSPRDYHDPIVAQTPDETLDTYFKGYEAELYTGGHTHTQFVRRYYGNRVMNPGSVGMSYYLKRSGEAVNPAVAEYALLKTEADELSIEFRRVLYDLQSLFDAVAACDMPYKDKWLEGFRLGAKGAA